MALNVPDQPPTNGSYRLALCGTCDARECMPGQAICRECREMSTARAWREQRIVESHRERVRDDQ